MNPFEYITMIARLRQEELLREAEKNRLLSEAFRSKSPNTSGTAKFLAFLGNQLASAGLSLEKRYGGQPEPRTTMNPQSYPGGCT